MYVMFLQQRKYDVRNVFKSKENLMYVATLEQKEIHVRNVFRVKNI